MTPEENRNGIISFKNASIISIIVLILFILVIIVFRNDSYFKIAISDLIMPVFNLLAVISLLYAARESRVYGKRVYYAWLVLGIGQLFFALGDISWAYIELYLNQSPVFSISDVFYLAYYPIFALGIFLLPRVRFNRLDLTKIILDILIVGLTLGLMIWTLLVNPLLIHSENPESTYVFLSYVILDLVLLFALLDMIYNRISSLKQDPLLLLAGGILVQIVSDIIFIYQTGQGTFSSGSLVDVGWLSGFILIGLAGLLQSKNARSYSPSQSEIKSAEKEYEWTAYIPFIWVVLAYIIFAWGYSHQQISNFQVIIWMGALILTLLLIRQLITYQEIRNLYHAAEIEILKRLNAEKILKSERDKAQMYLDIAGVIILVLDVNERVILINKKGSEILGFEEDEIIGKKWSSHFIPQKHRKEIENAFDKIISGEIEQYHVYENPVLSKNGEELFISWNNSLMHDNEGKIIGIISSGENITQKRIEEQERIERAKKTIERQNSLLSLSKKNISELNQFLKDLTEADSKTLNVERVSVWFFNKQMTEIQCKDLYMASKNSHESGNVLQAEIYPRYFKAMKELHSIAASDAQNDPLTHEFTENYLKPLRIVSMLDTPIWLRGKLIGVICHEHVGDTLREWSLEEQDFAGSIANMVSLSLEADEHRKAEEKIKESLNEKEVLLKEIHHRVKNNMQIVSSLLNLQSRQIKDPEAIAIFKESQSRVKSMSMVHERLYRSKTLSNIDFAEYINSLSLNLLRTYAANPDLIKLTINAEPLQINIDTAIPCGLILTELVSNAFKYAFPNDRSGEIEIDFYETGDLFTLIISDNGIGIPDSVDINNSKSLGLLLVNSLIDQIEGDMKLDTSNGTKFTIKFKEMAYEARI